MKITEKDELAKHVNLFDCNGNKITHCISYDTETKEAELYATINGLVVTWNLNRQEETKDLTKIVNREIVKFKCHLAGAKLIDKRTNEEIK